MIYRTLRINGKEYVISDPNLPKTVEEICKEMEDLHTDFDGTTYATAGEAVRAQTGALSENIKRFIESFDRVFSIDSCSTLIGTGSSGVCEMGDNVANWTYEVGDSSDSYSGICIKSADKYALCAGYTLRITVTNNSPIIANISGAVNSVKSWGDIYGATWMFTGQIQAGATQTFEALIPSGLDYDDMYLMLYTKKSTSETITLQITGSLKNNAAPHYFLIDPPIYAESAGEAINATSSTNAGGIAVTSNIRLSNAGNMINKWDVYQDEGSYYIDYEGYDNSAGEWKYSLVGIPLGNWAEIKDKTFFFDYEITGDAFTRVFISPTYHHWNEPMGNVIPGEFVPSEFLSAYVDQIEENDTIYLVFARNYPESLSEHPAFTCNIRVCERHPGLVIATHLSEKLADKLGIQGAQKQKIICWGDSLTAQGGWTTKLEALSGLEVLNAGTGGENSSTISSRQGADHMYCQNITIPADKTAVTIATYSKGISTFMSGSIRPLLQGGSSHVNPVTIGEVEGTLIWTGSSYDDTAGAWTFTRSEAGDEVVISRPTPIITAYDRLYNNSSNIPIIFMGTNDGTFDIETMYLRIKNMLRHARADKFLVIGLTYVRDGAKAFIDEYHAAMEQRFGRYFVNLLDYLVTYGMEDLGLIPTTEDETALSAGTLPPSMTTDGIHYTEAVRSLIGELIYKRMVELNIV